MNRQSEFGRLFRRSALGGPEPIENYISEALAIAIEHDDRPMRLALARVSWPEQRPHTFVSEQISGISAETQRFLPGFDRISGDSADSVGFGYLDLVLDIRLSDGTKLNAWVEVKAETGEHGEQLDDYSAHALQRSPAPSIFALSKYDIRQTKHLTKGIGWLEWKSVGRAIQESGSSVDGRWADLLAFLGEEGIAWRSLSLDLKAPDAHIEVLIEVNNQIKQRWHSAGIWWKPAELRKAAGRGLSDNERMVVTAGPLTYGLVPSTDGWLWSITVGCKNYQGVALDQIEMRARADNAGLPSRWERSTTRSAVLSLQVPLRDYADRADAAAWFAAALDELGAHGVMALFLDGLTAKRKGQAVDANMNEGPQGNVT